MEKIKKLDVYDCKSEVFQVYGDHFCKGIKFRKTIKMDFLI